MPGMSARKAVWLEGSGPRGQSQEFRPMGKQNTADLIDSSEDLGFDAEGNGEPW